MRTTIIILAFVSIVFASCGDSQTATKEKELELKEQELKQKEESLLDDKKKEIELKEQELKQKEEELKSKSDISTQKSGFYILNVAAVSTHDEAESKSEELIRKGYSAGFLWIPDYKSLSGAKFYSVYIGPFDTQYECEVATDKYKKIFPGSYGLLVSQESKRVQINGVGKVTVTDN
jgi:hypothetical protein